MSLKILFRQPWKLLICALFLAATLLAGLVFAIQYRLDGVSMDYTAETYAAVGTVYQSQAESPAAAEISPDILRRLQANDAVQDMDTRTVLSAKAPGQQNLPSFFMTAQANHLLFFKGMVTDLVVSPDFEGVEYNVQYCAVQPQVIYAGQGSWLNTNDTAILCALWDESAGLEFAEGQSYYFIALSQFNSSLGVMGPELYTYCIPAESETAASNGFLAQQVRQNGILPVPEGLSAEAQDEYILAYWDELGLTPYMDEIAFLDDVFTVNAVSDMQLLLSVVNEVMFFPSGRGIRPDDAGQKVCVVSRQLAQQQHLQVGDSVSLALGDGCYTSGGYATGYPALGELPDVRYGEPQPYTIIGVYDYLSFDAADSNLLYNYNDIFIPESAEINVEQPVTPRSFSFRVNPAAYDEFLDSMVDELVDNGYSLQLTASRWEDVEPTYNAMAGRRNLTLAGAVLALVLGSAVWLLLLRSLYRREFALRELFGTPFGHSSGAFFVPFAVSGVLAGILAIAAADAVYLLRLQPQADALAPGRMPANSEILVLLIALVLIQLAVCALVLLFLAWRTRKTALVRLLK